MIFIVGKTRCAGCGLPIDVMDDVVPVTPVLAAGTRWSGHFHRGCFDRLPDRAAVVRNWREFTERQVRDQPRTFPVMASSPRFLIVARPAEEKIGVYFLDCFAELRLARGQEWDEFRDFVQGDELRGALASPDTAELVAPSEAFSIHLGQGAKQAQLAWTIPIGREIEFPPAPFEQYVATNGHPAGFVDFAELAADKDGIQPSNSFGDLARCRGEARRVDSTPRGYKVVYTARQPVAIELGRDGLVELQRVIAKVTI